MITDLLKRQKTTVSTTAAEQLDESGPAFAPDVDIFASNDELVLAVDIPGVSKGNVSIVVDENNTLIIRAKNTNTEPGKAMLHQYSIGNYYRAFQIGEEFDKDKISAKLDNGLLEVRITKREEAKPRKIQISA